MVLVPLASVAVLVLVVLTGDAGAQGGLAAVAVSTAARPPRGSRAAAGTT